MVDRLRVMEMEKLTSELSARQKKIINATIPKDVRDAMEDEQKTEIFVQAAMRSPKKVIKLETTLLDKLKGSKLQVQFLEEINSLNAAINEMFNTDLPIFD